MSTAGTVLIVDDDESYRRILGLQLDYLGYTHLSAACHAEALRCIQEHPEIALIILDYSMGSDDPARLVPQIRACRPATHIVGRSITGRLLDSHAIGVSQLVQKPFDLDRLRHVLERFRKEARAG